MGQTLSLNNLVKAIQSYILLKLLHALLYRQEKLRQRTSKLIVIQRIPSKSTFQDLPNELILAIFSFLELKPFIISHGVCKKWKQLLPLADIHPIRRRLFNLFHHMLQHPRFLETRPWTLKTLRPFERKAYIEALLSQYPAVPEEFRLWILEWPARMVPFGIWPSSPFTFHRGNTLEEASGVNWLAYLPGGSPSLLKVLHRYPSGSHVDHWIPALLCWKLQHRASWLIFEKDEPDLFGRVMVIDTESADPPLVCRLPLTADRKDESFQMYRDWIQFLEETWDQQLAIVLSPRRSKYCIGSRDEPLSYPVTYGLGEWVATTLPSLPWVSNEDPEVLKEVQSHLHY
ncbi:hypothetical protein D9613_008751 [Agrocybe pediades]|uniref:F-box domain-containing protein n=1 Tax=Agrocybe pediades TaxID=84607 RepID=A0A8H4QT41_9AGAR|nr:hypothetical protein D9613_008751 [Agrocybe pediades]